MDKSPQELQKILSSANQVAQNIMAELDRAVSTPTRDWTIDSRRRAMEALSIKARKAAETFASWMYQNVPIKNVAKICGSLDSLQHQAHQTHFSNSRTHGTADLRRCLKELTDVFGDGCQLEMEVGGEEAEQPADVIQDKVRPPSPKLSMVDPNERPYSIKDLMVLHNLSFNTVSRLYEHEPGVLVLQASAEHRRKIGRRYRTIRVPRHVYLRVRRRLEIR
jgi:hypothetical protein